MKRRSFSYHFRQNIFVLETLEITGLFFLMGLLAAYLGLDWNSTLAVGKGRRLRPILPPGSALKTMPCARGSYGTWYRASRGVGLSPRVIKMINLTLPFQSEIGYN